MVGKQINRLLLSCFLLLGLDACGMQGGPSGGAAYLPSAAIVPYTKSPQGPLIGVSGHDFRRPWVMQESGGDFRMWLSDRDVGSGLGNRILSLQSANGWDWVLDEGPIFQALSDGWEAGQVTAPSVLRHEDTYYLWYVGGEGAGIGLATSEDGYQWERHQDNPVVTPNDNWENALDLPSLGDPSVLQIDGEFRMWFLAGGGTGIAVAHSPDGIRWSRVSDEPVFLPAEPTTEDALWDGDRLLSANVSITTTPAGRLLFRLWYGGARINIEGALVGGLGFAGSFDGLDWVRSDANPILQDGGYDEGDAFPILFQGEAILFFTQFWKKEGTNRKVVRLASHGLDPLFPKASQ